MNIKEYKEGFTVDSAMQENARYIDSIEGKVVALKDQFRELLTTVITSDMTKGLIGGLAEGMTMLNKFMGGLDDIGMALPVTIGTIATLFKSLKASAQGQDLGIIGSGLYKNIKKQQTQVKILSNDMVNASKNVRTVLTSDSNVLAKNVQSSNTRIQKALGTSSKQFKVFRKDASGNLSRVSNTFTSATVVAEGTSKKFGQTAKQMVLSGAKSMAASVGVSLLNGALITLGATLVSKVIGALDDYIHRAEDAYQASKEMVDKTQDELGKLNSDRSTVVGMSEDFEKLSNKLNLTSEEAQKLSEYKQQLAEIFPDLVTGYDEKGDPILALSGSADDLIKKLDVAIAKKQELLKLEQKSEGQNAGKTVGKYRTNTGGNIETAVMGDNLGKNPFYDDSWLTEGIRSLESGAKQYQKVYSQFKENISKINRENSEKNVEYIQREQSQQIDAFNELSDNIRKYQNYSTLGSTQKADMQQLISLYDWSNELVAENLNKRNEFLEGFDKISAYSVDHYKQVEKWNEVIESANNAYQATGNIDDYKKAVAGVAKEFEKLTGIKADDWIKSFMPQLNGTLDEEKIRLSNFLKGFGKDLIDIDLGDSVAKQLETQFQDLNTFIGQMSDTTIPFETKIDLVTKIGKSEDNLTDLPPQLREMIVGITDGGDKVTQKEMSFLAMISTVIQNEGVVGDPKNTELLNKLAMGELTEAEIQAGITLKDGTQLDAEVLRYINDIQKNKDNQIPIDLNKDYLEEQLKEVKEKLKEFKKINENDKVSELFTSGTIDTSQMEYINELMKSMPFGDHTIDLICELGGAFNNGQLQTYEGIVRYLLENPSIANKVGVTVVGKETVDAVKTKLDEVMKTDEEKKIAIEIEDGLAEGNLNRVRDALDKLDEDKQIEIVTDITDALEKLDTVDAKEIRDKLITAYLETDEVDEKTGEIESKPIEKSVVFKSENFAETLGQTIEIDENGKAVIKPITFSTDGYVDTLNKTNTIAEKSKSETKNVIMDGNKGYADTVSKEDTVTQKAKDETKTVTMDENGYKATLDKEIEIAKKAKPETKKVTFIGSMSDGLKAIFDKINKFISGATIPVRFGQGKVEEFKNISDTPVEIAPQSAPTMPSSDVSVNSVEGESATPTEGSSNVSTTALKDFGAIGSSKSTKTKINISSKNLLYALKNSINMFQELENRISRCTNQLALLDKKMERSTGTKRIKNLQKQNELYEQQVGLQKEYYDSLIEEKKILRKELKDKGFTFNNQGNLTSYEEKLAKMQKQQEKLEKAYEKAQKAESNYNGKSDKKKKSLSKSTENAKEKLDKYQEKLDDVKNLTDEYIKLQYTELPKAEQEWQDMKNAIEENKDEIEKLLREDKLYKFRNSVTGLTNEFKTLGNQLDLLDAKLQYSTGREKVNLYGQEIKEIEKQRTNLQKTIDQYNEMVDVYKESLSSYGFTFDENNNVTNQKEVLDKYQNTDDLEKVTELLEEYISLQTDELPDAIVQWEELGNKIKDIQNDKLEIVKDMEEEITKIYEDEIDKRKDAIEEEKDARVKALEDQKKAYQDYRSEVDYKDDYNEQLDKVNKLKSKIAILERDTSLASRSKLQEAYDELAEEEKALRDIQQERLDQQIEDMYDKEIEKAEKDSEDKIKALEDLWTPAKISEMVTKDLATNTFTDLDGNVKNLRDTMIEFAETSGDALGVMGDSIKNDLINNLQVATDVLRQYSDIYNSLGLKQYGTNYKDMYEKNNPHNTNLQLGGIHINIQGNADDVTIDKLTKAIEEEFKYISNKL